MIAIDFRGGERLATRQGNSLKLESAGEMLLLDPVGTLIVRNELDDLPAYDKLTEAEREAARANAGNPFGGGLGDLGNPARGSR